MQMFLLSINAVLPILILMLLGYLFKRVGFFSEAFFSQASKLVFRVALPILIFSKLSSGEPLEKMTSEQIKLILIVVIGIIVSFIIIRGLFKKVVSESHKASMKGVMLQGSFRSNYLIIGYPILHSIYGDRIIVNFALLGAFLIPMFNILSVMALNEGDEDSDLDIFEMVKSILKNPLIIAVFLGFLVKVLEFDLPISIDNTFDLIGSLATPLGLISIGGFFEFHSLKRNWKNIYKVSLFKLVILPVVFTIIGYVLGLSIENIILIAIIFGGPTAVSSFAMAREMNGDTELAASIVIVTSLMCSFTLVVLMTTWMNVLS